MTKSILVEQYTLTGSSNLLKSFQKRVEYKLLQSGNLVIKLWQNTKIYTACFKKFPPNGIIEIKMKPKRWKTGVTMGRVMTKYLWILATIQQIINQINYIYNYLYSYYKYIDNLYGTYSS